MVFVLLIAQSCYIQLPRHCLNHFNIYTQPKFYFLISLSSIVYCAFANWWVNHWPFHLDEHFIQTRLYAYTKWELVSFFGFQYGAYFAIEALLDMFCIVFLRFNNSVSHSQCTLFHLCWQICIYSYIGIYLKDTFKADYLASFEIWMYSQTRLSNRRVVHCFQLNSTLATSWRTIACFIQQKKTKNNHTYRLS